MGASLPLSIASGSLQASAAPIPIVNLLCAVGSHLIVWHHLAFYGPVSDIAYVTSPALFDWLVDYGRMAVQVFFVLGGFVTARKLSRPRQWTPQILVREIVARYRRIGIPYLAALLVAVVANEVARRSMDHESISATPSVTQLVAHAVFLQDVLDYEPLTAGIWYLAIDFQLGLLVLVTLAAAQWVRGDDPEAGFRAAQWLFWPLAATSLLWLNRLEQFDHYALYFFGSYFGGMVVAWTLAGRLPRMAILAYVGLVALALAVDWRPRLAVAIATGLTIFLAEATRERRNALTNGAWRLVQRFAQFWKRALLQPVPDPFSDLPGADGLDRGLRDRPAARGAGLDDPGIRRQPGSGDGLLPADRGARARAKPGAALANTPQAQMPHAPQAQLAAAPQA